MKQSQKLSILFYLKNSKLNSKGLSPIWIRITIDGSRSECSTGHQIFPKDWDSKKMMVDKSNNMAQSLNEYLMVTRVDIIKNYNILQSIQDWVSAEDLKNSFKGIKEKVVLFLTVFEQYRNSLLERVDNKDLSLGRYKHFNTLLEKSRLFIKHQYQKSDIPIKDLKLNFINEFYQYLKTVHHISQNTAMKHAKNLKQVLDYAVMLEYIPSNAFQFFKCSFKKSNRTKLTSQEIDIIYKKEISNSRLSEVRDCYIFGIFTGYAYKEQYDLTPANIQIGMDGKKWIIKQRQKTSSPENVPLLPIALEIVEKYKNHPYCKANNKLLPVNSNQRYNEYLKEIAAICNINKTLTTHTARHTFATTVTLENGVPLETVSKMLGHTDIKTTQIYAEITQTKVSEDMFNLQDKIEKRMALNASQKQA